MSHDPRAYQLEWLRLLQSREPTETVNDPLSAAARRRDETTARPSLIRGIVVDAIPRLRACLVQLENMAPPIMCALGGQTGFASIGARELNFPAAGSAVWVAVAPKSDHGVILAAEPPAAAAAPPPGDWVHATSRCGLLVDVAHGELMRATRGLTPVDWSAGRPIDSIAAGEYGAITETGMRIFLDSFMAQVAADEATGLFVHYHDQAVKLLGADLEITSAGSIEAWFDAAGEIRGYRGWTPYPWEQMGALRPDVATTRSRAAREVQIDTPWYGAVEPLHDDQTPYHRRVFLGGYLGQGGADWLTAPPPEGDLLRESTPVGPETSPVGLIAERRTLAGGYSLVAAGGVSIGRSPIIPAPMIRRRPADVPEDDEVVAPAGRRDGAVVHKMSTGIGVDPDDDSPGSPSGRRMAALPDSAAHRRNWEELAALHRAAGEWGLPEESATFVAAEAAPETFVPPFADLAEAHALADPEPVLVRIDDRYEEVAYAPGLAGIDVNPDGSVSIRSACGCSILMHGGNLYLDAPGDVFLSAGRNVLQWAGRDAITRAHGCFEASAATGDARIKSERNLHVLAGNGGAGGLLLESRGVDAFDYIDKSGTDVVSGGVQIKASKGSVVAWGDSLYLRSLNSGDIVLDADAGGGGVVQIAQRCERYAETSCDDYFGIPGDVAAVNSFGAFGANVSGDLTITGGLTATSGAVIRGGVTVLGGSFAAERSSGEVADLGDDGVVGMYNDRVKDRLDAAAAAAEAASTRHADRVAARYYGDSMPGNTDVINAAGFTFRDTEQCRAEQFELWESPWRQTAREGGLDLPVWTEPPVDGPLGPTLPYPGRVRMIEDSAYLRQPLTFFDVKRGVAIDRADNVEKYENPLLAPVDATTIDGGYTILDHES